MLIYAILDTSQKNAHTTLATSAGMVTTEVTNE